MISTLWAALTIIFVTWVSEKKAPGFLVFLLDRNWEMEFMKSKIISIFRISINGADISQLVNSKFD